MPQKFQTISPKIVLPNFQVLYCYNLVQKNEKNSMHQFFISLKTHFHPLFAQKPQDTIFPEKKYLSQFLAFMLL